MLNASELDAKIELVELFSFEVTKPRHFSFGTWSNRQHAILRLGIGSHSGWSEGLCAVNAPRVDIEKWGECFKDLVQMSVSGALQLVQQRRDLWTFAQLEMAEIALIDLAGRLIDVPAIQLLELPGRSPVPGLFCILEADPSEVSLRSKLAQERNFATHVKLKAFGNAPLDMSLISAARAVLGPHAFLMADANRGYFRIPGSSLLLLIQYLDALATSGLDACEDPADLTNAEWVRLQSALTNLSLIPDYPVRCTWLSLVSLLPGMGKAYNVHPQCLGSVIESVELARKIQSFGSGVMIGDDSFIGPACTTWQQIAIGVGAEWVEALEKPDESDAFLKCVISQATSATGHGCVGLQELRPGFGLEVDSNALRALAVTYCRV
jgi:hypothetical protein